MSNIEEIKPVGRPSKYEEKFIGEVYRLALLGLKDVEIASVFEVTESTLNNWKNEHPEFLESLRMGRTEADGRVARALYKRANGYDVEEVKEEVGYDGRVKRTVTKKHIPPDPASMVIWLKNRQGKHWRDKFEIDHKKQVDVTVNFELPRPERAVAEVIEGEILEAEQLEAHEED